VTIPQRQLPDGTPISAFGFGCSAYWSKPSFSRDKALELVLRAQGLGINYFDTGPSYGGGDAERRLGLALRQLDRKKLVISSKVGTYADSHGKLYRSFEPARIKASVQESLDRLGLTYLDILYLHGPSLANLSPDVLDCLDELKAGGLIRYSGANTFDRSVLARLVHTPIDVVMPQYSVFDVSSLELINSLKRVGKTIISGTALGQGLFNFRSLIPSSRKSAWYLLRMLKNDPLFVLTRYRARQRIAELGQPPLDAALLFLLNTPAVTSSVFGTTSIEHLEQNAAAVSRITEHVARV
jgi:aryl-alcohol dehydrogenase-like predicted oxidoreductase